jgi:hypothetical protein
MFRKHLRSIIIGIVILFICGFVSLAILSLTSPRLGNVYSGPVSGAMAFGDPGRVDNLVLAQATSAPFDAPAEADETVEDGIISGEQEARPRVVLRNASIRLIVEDSDASLETITAMTEEMNGWVVSSNAYQATTNLGEKVTQATMTIRVPAERLEEALQRLREGALSVSSESITGQDVTAEYVDLTSRVNNLKAAEEQLQEIMDSAQRTEDVVNVYNELVRVRGEIEMIQGRLNYFDEAAAFSSISIELVPDGIANPARIEIATWSPGRTAETAVGSLLNFLRFLVDAVITLVIVGVPIALILGVPAWLIYRAVRRRSANRRAAS